MRRILNWIVGLPAALIVIGFAVANRQWVTVSFDPFSQADPFASADLPLWALLFCGIFLGLICGWLGCWVAQAKWRRAAREARAEAQRALDDLARAKTAASDAGSSGVPSLTGMDPF